MQHLRLPGPRPKRPIAGRDGSSIERSRRARSNDRTPKRGHGDAVNDGDVRGPAASVWIVTHCAACRRLPSRGQVHVTVTEIARPDRETVEHGGRTVADRRPPALSCGSVASISASMGLVAAGIVLVRIARRRVGRAMADRSEGATPRSSARSSLRSDLARSRACSAELIVVHDADPTTAHATRQGVRVDNPRPCGQPGPLVPRSPSSLVDTSIAKSVCGAAAREVSPPAG